MSLVELANTTITSSYGSVKMPDVTSRNSSIKIKAEVSSNSDQKLKDVYIYFLFFLHMLFRDWSLITEGGGYKIGGGEMKGGGARKRFKLC